MNGWIWKGLRGGIVTTRYPRGSDRMPTAYRGMVDPLVAPVEEQARGAAACPTSAIVVGDQRAAVVRQRCIQCGRCAAAAPGAFALTNDFDISQMGPDPEATGQRIRDAVRALGRSVHLRHIDTGSDGSEEQELQAIFNPFYDANRLGIFLTAAPRHADVLVVTGPVTMPMVDPLRRTYDAMPEPKLVVALGTTACSGGLFARPEIAGPVDRIVPVDVYIPGSPPAPLTILHGLLLALGRAQMREEAS
ncbi:MAG: NADH-quinone oxidoreductase subunit B family protein [Vulcanimicrobiaceae bacterium]